MIIVLLRTPRRFGQLHHYKFVRLIVKRYKNSINSHAIWKYNINIQNHPLEHLSVTTFEKGGIPYV